jgi:membrane protease YdiL (CAAX protease family)
LTSALSTPGDPVPVSSRPRGWRILLWPFWNGEERRLRTLWRLVLTMVCVQLVLRGMVLLGAPLNGLSLKPTVLRTIGILIPIFLATWFVDRRTFAHLGLRLDARWLADFVFGCVLGVALIALGVGVLHALGWMETGRVPQLRGADVAVVCLTLLVAAFFEEVLFRSWLLRNMADGFKFRPVGPRWALVVGAVLSSALFGLGHANNPNATLVSSLNVALAGIFLAVPYLITGRLGLSFGVHWTWNVAQGPLFGLPVSGNDLPASLLLSRETGPDEWTGGPFGIEAGITTLLLLALAIALIVGWTRWREGRVALRTGLLSANGDAVTA